MRLKSLTIENFKGISDPVTIELKPITLLFGPNSAGKSTIIQALHYFREILERGNVDVDRIVGADESFNLGGFTNFVHNHDRNRTINLKVEFDIEEDELEPFYLFADGKNIDIYKNEMDGTDLEGTLFDLTRSFQVRSAWVSVSIAWSFFQGRAYLSEYETGIDGLQIAKITCAEDGKRIAISSFNFNHPTFSDENYEYGGRWHASDDPVEYRSAFEYPMEAVILPQYFRDNDSLELLLENQTSVLPRWTHPLTIASECLIDPYSPNGDVTEEHLLERLREISAYLSQVLVRPGGILLEKLKKAFYIGPIRKVPSRNYNPVRSADLSRWSSGLAAWDKLHLGTQDLVGEVGMWLARSDMLNAGYSLKLRRYKDLDVESPLYIALSSGSYLDEDSDRLQELKDLPEKRELVLIDEERLVQVFPQDVGVGISQLLPVVVGALDDDIEVLMVEQPELHIHPGLQCRIGDLLIHQIQDNDKIFLIETHSEHLLLRLLRRVREKTEGEIPPGMYGLRKDELSINYVDLSNQDGFRKQMRVSQLLVSDDGDSLGEWPEGFFEERAGELF